MTTAPGIRSNPYIGPRAFRTGETLYGREREAAELLDLLIAERIVLLYSPSGAGKTSLIQAALIPRLQEEQFRVLPPMRVNLPLQAAPGPEGEPPNRYVLSALLSLEEGLPEAQRRPAAELARVTLGDYLEQWPREGDEPEGELLIFDQFEEILTADPTDRAAKEAFFEQLRPALRDRRRWALFSMREDYVAALVPYVRRVPTRLKSTFRLDLLGVQAARAAIQGPARAAGVEFEAGAAQQLIDDLRRTRVQRLDGTTEEQPGPSVEPVQLQVVCYRLWERLPGDAREVQQSHLKDVGDVDTALADYYAERVQAAAAATGERERAIREWFDRHLITPAGLRGQVLQEPERSKGLDNRALRELESAHLIRAERRRGATWFELAHDRLVQPVRTNNLAWFAVNLSPLQRRAAAWDDQNRPDDLLFHGRDLAEARRWAARRPEELLSTESEFLAACAVRDRRRKLAVTGVLSIVLLALVSSVLAYRIELERRRTAEERDRTIGAISHLTDDLPPSLKVQPDMVPFLISNYEKNLKLLAKMDSDPITQRARAVNQQQWGDLCRSQGQREEALRHYQQAVDIGLPLLDRHPPSDHGQEDLNQDRLNLAAAYSGIGDIRKEQKELLPARAAYEQGLALETPLAGNKHVLKEQARSATSGLAVLYLRLSEISLEQGERRGAQEACVKSRALAQALAHEARDAPTQRTVAGILHGIAQVKLKLGDWADAQQVCQQRVALEEALNRGQGDPQSAARIGEAYADLAYADLYARRPREAHDAADRGLSRDPQNMHLMISLAHGYLFDGQFSDALQSYQMLLAWKEVKVDSDRGAAQVVLDDFKQFRKAGLTRPEMAKIEALFNRAPPQAARTRPR